MVADMKREVTWEEGKQYAQDQKCDLFCEVSALTGENIERLFYALTRSTILFFLPDTTRNT